MAVSVVRLMCKLHNVRDRSPSFLNEFVNLEKAIAEVEEPNQQIKDILLSILKSAQLTHFTLVSSRFFLKM